MFKKNTAATGFTIGVFINSSTGAEVTTGTPTCTRILDGTAGSCANAASYNATLTAWEIDLDAADLNGDCVGLVFKLASCLSISYTLHTVTGVPDASGNYPANIADVAQGGSSAVLTLKQLKISGANAAEGSLHIANTYAAAGRTADGIYVTAADGEGVNVISTEAAGAAIRLQGGTNGGAGLRIEAATPGTDLMTGLDIESSRATAIRVDVSGANDINCVYLTASGTGHGILVNGGDGATGNAIHAAALSTNGSGIVAIGTGSGSDVLADITGNITGNLSGSVNSVTTKTGYALASDGMDSVVLPADIITAISIDTGAFTADAFAANALVDATFAAGSLDKAWDTAARTLTAATNITSTGGTTFTQTGDSFARIGAAGVGLTAVALADVTSDAVLAGAIWDAATVTYGSAGSYGEAIEAIVADTNELQTDDIPTTLATLATSAELATHDAKLDTVDGIVDAILLDTAEIGTAGVGLTNVTLGNNAHGGAAASLTLADYSDFTGAAAANPNVLQAGTITVSDQTNFTLNAGSADDDAYLNMVCVIEDAATATQKSVRTITAYVGATKTVTIDSAPDFTIVDTDKFSILAVAPGSTPPTVGEIRTELEGAGTHLTLILADTGELQTDWANGGRLDLILDIIAADTTTDIPALIATAQSDLDIITGATGVNLLAATQASIDAIETDTTTDIPALIATAQADLDTITGTDGVTLATAQALYAPATAAQVNAEVVDALNVDTYVEPTAVPAATASLADKIGWVCFVSRNKITTTDDTQTIYADNTTTDIATAAVSDDATTFTRGEWTDA